MFENLTDKLSKILHNWRGQGKITEANIKPVLKEIKESLLEADVALEVVKKFIQDVEAKALGEVVPDGLTPEQFFIKLVDKSLIDLMSVDAKSMELNLNITPPAVILLAGLQGAGKTTLVGKLAYWLKHNLKKSVAIANCDTQRDEALDQLRVLSDSVGSYFFEPQDFSDPEKIARSALTFAKEKVADVLLLDTAGRLHIDEKMMQQIASLHQIVNPIETLFVVDSMTGQDAALSAKAFNSHLPLTGVVLTKVDGDARGGAALSVAYITGKPIKFLSNGEKISDLEIFYPERIASRILGMGDMLTLIEEIERKTDKAKAEKLAQKFKKGQGFDLDDLRDQLRQMLKMGGLASMADKLPGMSAMSGQIKSHLADDKSIIQMLAALDSMTRLERLYPAKIESQGRRKRRIAEGSGTSIPLVNRVLKQHAQMQKMMKKMGNPKGMMKMMQGLQGIPGMGNLQNLFSNFGAKKD